MYFSAIVTVFDLQNLKSLENAEQWLGEALSVHVSQIPYLFLVGSKMDLLVRPHIIKHY